MKRKQTEMFGQQNGESGKETEKDININYFRMIHRLRVGLPTVRPTISPRRVSLLLNNLLDASEHTAG